MRAACAEIAPPQTRKLRPMTGNEAIARGAWEAGVKVAAAYPGTPSTEILEIARDVPGERRARAVVDQREGGAGRRHRRVASRAPARSRR